MSILDKIKKNSTIGLTSTISESTVLLDKFEIPTSIPAMNIALSGSLKGGITGGTTIFAGESKRFKSMYSLFLVSEYMKSFPESVCIFYDSEFGTPLSYFEKMGIDLDRVVHCPITDIDQLKHDIVVQLTELERKDRVVVMIDSIGNLASKKELDDSIEGKSAADFTRAKTLKAMFRQITPILAVKDIPLIAINHTYKEIGMFPKDIQSGGCLEGGTKIIMSDGSTKAIEDVKVGDMVKTLGGENEVYAVWDPETLDEGEPECYRVTFEDGNSYTCSANHRYKIGEEWVKAKDLVENDDVVAI